jgi:hypothetical protein
MSPELTPAGAAEDYPRFMATMTAAFDRLKGGRKVYGAFSPATDRRDLPREAEEELLDAIVYAYLAILNLPLVTGGRTGAEHREGYHLVLVPLPGDPPPEVRLRQGLKTLLRSHRLRCVSVEEIGSKRDQSTENSESLP